MQGPMNYFCHWGQLQQSCKSCWLETLIVFVQEEELNWTLNWTLNCHSRTLTHLGRCSTRLHFCQFVKQFTMLYKFYYLLSLRNKGPYSELFLSVFSRIRNEYGEILRISSYSVRMLENTDQNKSEYGHFLRSVCFSKISWLKVTLIWANIEYYLKFTSISHLLIGFFTCKDLGR